MIGPHEGKELSLMLDGRKPMAMFIEVAGENGVVPDEMFATYVREARIIRIERRFRPRPEHRELPSVRAVFYCLPGEEWRADAAARIVAPVFETDRKPTDRDDAELGRLLGYSDEEIESFLSKSEPSR